MARGVITPTVVNRAGINRTALVPTTGDATNGHTIPNRGMMWVEVENTNGAATARDVSFRLTGGVDGQSITPKTKTIAAGQTWLYGPFPAGYYGGNLLVDVAHADLTILAFELEL